MENTISTEDIVRRLAEPFDPSELKYKPQVINGNRAIAVTYVDARLIQDRLDEVLGVENWQDEYQPLPGGSVLCRLQVRLGNAWITKMDVGSPSEQPDEGDRTKAAFSDALKRAAVKFGVGRYLYRLPVAWVDYDPSKRRIVAPPKLPAWALPSGSPQPKQPPTESPKQKQQPSKPKQEYPVDGTALAGSLRGADELGSFCRFFAPGALLERAEDALRKEGFPGDLGAAEGPAIKIAADAGRKFYAETFAKWSPAYRGFATDLYRNRGSQERLREIIKFLKTKKPTEFEENELDELWDIVDRLEEEHNEKPSKSELFPAPAGNGTGPYSSGH